MDGGCMVEEWCIENVILFPFTDFERDLLSVMKNGDQNRWFFGFDGLLFNWVHIQEAARVYLLFKDILHLCH